jgi:hypothetical protein
MPSIRVRLDVGNEVFWAGVETSDSDTIADAIAKALAQEGYRSSTLTAFLKKSRLPTLAKSAILRDNDRIKIRPKPELATHSLTKDLTTSALSPKQTAPAGSKKTRRGSRGGKRHKKNSEKLAEPSVVESASRNAAFETAAGMGSSKRRRQPDVEQSTAATKAPKLHLPQESTAQYPPKSQGFINFSGDWESIAAVDGDSMTSNSIFRFRRLYLSDDFVPVLAEVAYGRVEAVTPESVVFQKAEILSIQPNGNPALGLISQMQSVELPLEEFTDVHVLRSSPSAAAAGIVMPDATTSNSNTLYTPTSPMMTPLAAAITDELAVASIPTATAVNAAAREEFTLVPTSKPDTVTDSACAVLAPPPSEVAGSTNTSVRRERARVSKRHMGIGIMFQKVQSQN